MLKIFSHLFFVALAAFLLSSQNAHAAQCGYASGNSYSSAPQSVGSLCVAGTASSLSGNGPWNWTCSDGGGTVNCSSGICGVTFEWREGTFGACDCSTSLQSRGVWCYRNGVMTDPDQSGCYANAGPKPPWQQSCTPSGCVTPVAGACDNNTVNGCSSGSAFDISSDASNDYWKCSGSGGGANSGQCSKGKSGLCVQNGVKRVDVYFLADNTGSMIAPLTSVKNKASSILSRISGGDPRFAGVNANFAVGRYLGDPVEGQQQACPDATPYMAYLDMGEFGGTITGCSATPSTGSTMPEAQPVNAPAYELFQGMTNNQSATQNALNRWGAYFGGDVPEGQFYAMVQLAGGSTGWRPNAGHILIWMGDAYGHQETNNIPQAIAALNAQNISVVALRVPPESSQAQSIEYQGQAQTIANGTGGLMQNIDGLSDDQIANLIVNAIYTTVEDQCSP